MRSYSYDDLLKDLRKTIRPLKASNFDALLALSRGGLLLGQMIAHALDTQDLYCVNTRHYDNKQRQKDVQIANMPDLSGFKNVLVIDEILDSGETLQVLMQELNKQFLYTKFTSFVLFAKQDAVFKPDIWLNTADEWIEFFWEKDLKC